MDESTQRYRVIRTLLEHLVASWPWDRPGTAFENAKVYLDFHCADCGIKLSVNDLAVVLELETLRLGTVDTRNVPFYDSICVGCYIGRAAPECRSVEYMANRANGMEGRRLQDGRGREHPMLLASTETPHALAFQNTTIHHTEGQIAPLSASLLQAPIQGAVSSRPPRFNSAWLWQHTRACVLGAAVLFIVLALGIALISFPQQLHTSTLSRPTAPAEPTTAAPLFDHAASPTGNSTKRYGSRLVSFIASTCSTRY